MTDASDAAGGLRKALADLVSWFDDGPSSYGPWIIPAGTQGADDAVEAARAALSAPPVHAGEAERGSAEAEGGRRIAELEALCNEQEAQILGLVTDAADHPASGEDVEGLREIVQAVDAFMPSAGVAFLWSKETPPEDEVQRYRERYWAVKDRLAALSNRRKS